MIDRCICWMCCDGNDIYYMFLWRKHIQFCYWNKHVEIIQLLGEFFWGHLMALLSHYTYIYEPSILTKLIFCVFDTNSKIKRNNWRSKNIPCDVNIFILLLKYTLIYKKNIVEITTYLANFLRELFCLPFLCSFVFYTSIWMIEYRFD